MSLAWSKEREERILLHVGSRARKRALVRRVRAIAGASALGVFVLFLRLGHAESSVEHADHNTPTYALSDAQGDAGMRAD
jgi:hypothetical protein